MNVMYVNVSLYSIFMYVCMYVRMYGMAAAKMELGENGTIELPRYKQTDKARGGGKADSQSLTVEKRDVSDYYTKKEFSKFSKTRGLEKKKKRKLRKRDDDDDVRTLPYVCMYVCNHVTMKYICRYVCIYNTMALRYYVHAFMYVCMYVCMYLIN